MPTQDQNQNYAPRRENDFATRGLEMLESASDNIVSGKSFMINGFKETDHKLYPVNSRNGYHKSGINAVTLLQHSVDNRYRSGITLSSKDVSDTRGPITQKMPDGSTRHMERARNGVSSGERSVRTQASVNQVAYDKNGDMLRNPDGTPKIVMERGRPARIGITEAMFNNDQLQVDLLKDPSHAAHVEARPIKKMVAKEYVNALRAKAEKEPTLYNLAVASMTAAMCGTGYEKINLRKNTREKVAAELVHQTRQAHAEQHAENPNPPEYSTPFSKISTATQHVIKDIYPKIMETTLAIEKQATEKISSQEIETAGV